MAFRMKYTITPRYLPGPGQRRPMTPMDPCRFLVAHDTGNPGSTAAANVAYFARTYNDMSASAHLFVDDREIIECIPFLTAPPEKAWHVQYNVTTDNVRYGANANDAAGGIELCYGGSIQLQQAYERYVWVLAYACYRFGLQPTVDITGHYTLDPMRRTDPLQPLRLLGKSFTDLVADVAAEYAAGMIPDDPSPQPEPVLSPEDANKLIHFLSAGYFSLEDEAGRSEFNRLANELRRVSGQPAQ